MIIIDDQLKKREQEGTHIKVAIIGTGAIGFGLINQITRHTPGIKIITSYNRTISKAKAAYLNAGINDYCLTSNDLKAAQNAINSGQPVITDNVDLLLELKGIDVVVEATGTIGFALESILGAFEKGINVLSFNAELDSAFGPLLYKTAIEKGVRYGLGDGDQPGVTMNLYRLVKGMGFEPLLCGNIKGFLDHYRNPDTQKGFAAKWGMSPEMITNFSDGTKISFEQSCIANATGMKVAKRGMLGYISNEHVDDLTNLYDIDQLKELGGIVDYVLGAKPSPGVFIYATTDDPNSTRFLKYGKMGDGPLYSFYVPYHLLFFELPSSICRLIDFNDPVVVAKEGLVVDVVTAAKVELQTGDVLDGIGGFKTYGLCENHDIAVKEGLLPMALALGCKVKRKIARDKVLRYEDVEIDDGSILVKLYNKQENLSAKSKH